MGLLKDLKISRRFAVRGALGGIGVAMWLPVLDAMCNNNGTAFAAGDALPTSFGIWFWGNGIHTDQWTPAATGSGNAWQLPTALQDFADVKDSMTLVTGRDMMDAQFKGHGWGVVYVLAGGDGNLCTYTGDLATKLGSHHFETSDATQYQATIDQTIADAIQLANDTIYGLSAGIFKRDIDLAIRLARRVESGSHQLNSGPACRADSVKYCRPHQSGLERSGRKQALR